jgi:two-component system, chemotaxis family, chemotaxis protein CheY
MKEEDMGDKRLLVVDDSTTFRQLLCMSLARVEGVKSSDITQAFDGLDAFEKVKAGEYDLVLTDIRMPRMDGLELVRRVRQELEKKDLPIIIISTKGAEDEIELGMEMGATGYLSKPISMPRLKEVVTGLLGK